MVKLMLKDDLHAHGVGTRAPSQEANGKGGSLGRTTLRAFASGELRSGPPSDSIELLPELPGRPAAFPDLLEDEAGR